MKLPKMLIVLGALALFSANALQGIGQTNATKAYEEMSRAERLEFVGIQAKRIAREMSGTEYEFTPAFEDDIQKAVTQYTQRMARDRRLPQVFARGQAEAPRLIAIFRSRNVSPLIGIYLPWIESAYVNIPSPNAMGSVGMFQFIPSTGRHFGLSAEELLDVEKSADAAARYITESMETFKGESMKEALALLAYNRGGQKTARDLKAVLNDQNKQCSICALNAARDKLDETFRSESGFYVPLFFAAAIIGENPQAFGLQGLPLSSMK